MNSIEKEFGISEHDFVNLIHTTPHLRGPVYGAISEFFFDCLFENIPEVTHRHKPIEYLKNETPGDLIVTYKDIPISFEIKNIRSGKYESGIRRKIRINENVFGEKTWSGVVSLMNSRRRVVTFSDGSVVNGYNTKRGEVDVYAVCVKMLTGKWEYMYCLESDIPSVINSKNLTPLQQNEVLKGAMRIQWPPKAPWTDSLVDILEKVYNEKKINQSLSL